MRHKPTTSLGWQLHVSYRRRSPGGVSPYMRGFVTARVTIQTANCAEWRTESRITANGKVLLGYSATERLSNTIPQNESGDTRISHQSHSCTKPKKNKVGVLTKPLLLLTYPTALLPTIDDAIGIRSRCPPTKAGVLSGAADLAEGKARDQS